MRARGKEYRIMLNPVTSGVLLLVLLAVYAFLVGLPPQESRPESRRYYAHKAVTDANGVIAPWYAGAHGQLDFRIRVAVETLKRYPRTDPRPGFASVPHFIPSGAWRIDSEGRISIPPIDDWANGDLGQRAAYILGGLVDYVRYSGDESVIPLITQCADYLLDHCLTPDSHPWPGFLISVPTRGAPYGKANPKGFIQLDITAEVGIQMVRAAQLTGNDRWMRAARHWADLFAAKRRSSGAPWPRYANPEDVPWEDQMTGGIAFLLEFFDEIIATGYRGKGDSIVHAREAAIRHLRDVLLPRWTVDDTWGRNYWDWNDPVQAENVTEFVCRYLMAHPGRFPNWRNDVRNILGLFLNRTSVAPESGGDVYAGAWAFPESSSCCGRSLWYGPLELAPVWAEYGERTNDSWAREVARRMIILATYDAHATGVVEDNIDGGQIVAGDWFKIAHPMALKHCLAALAWMPELAPPGQNRLLRSTGVVQRVVLGPREVRYACAPRRQPGAEVLRVAGTPVAVFAGGRPLTREASADQPGYSVTPLPGGDSLVTVRRGMARTVRVVLGPADRAGAVAPRWSFRAQPQRVIFGYTGRRDYVDSAGRSWRPATEWVARAGSNADILKTNWWSEPRRDTILSTTDPEIYRYGAHGRDFWHWFTVAPGIYTVRLKLAETRQTPPAARSVSILINGVEVARDVDIAATAGGMYRAVDLVFQDIRPREGCIHVRLVNRHGGEAMVQAISVVPGREGAGAKPVSIQAAAAQTPGTLLRNPGFEEGGPMLVGSLGASAEAAGWRAVAAGPGQSYVWIESAYAIHPDWGLPKPRTGKEAMRTHTDGFGHTLLYQEAVVEASREYAASVWVEGVDLHGNGFGKHPSDSAGLWVQELDSAGRIVADHGKRAIHAAGPFTRLEVRFRTRPETARIRFVLDTSIACRYTEGHVTYDDCALEPVD
jgi:hypothetical protein